MNPNVIGVAYLISALLFIFGLKQLSSPVTARQGNRYAAVGMTIAIVATLLDRSILDHHRGNYILIGIALVIGAIIGIGSAQRVKMTAMPQMVAIFNGMGGGAAALVSILEFLRLSTGTHLAPAGQGATIMISTAIGCVSFAGSMIAFAKLQELMTGNAIRYPFHRELIPVLLVVIAALGVVAAFVTPNRAVFFALVALALILGFALVIPVGGADMPVIISLMNSLTGVAAAFTGFVLQNELLIVAGALVGASGTLLTQLMAKAMNRPLTNVLFAGVGAAPVGAGMTALPAGATVREISVDDAAMLMSYAGQVVIVPGYGLAVAQAQHQVRELASLLEERGVTVKYAIHPVAGRMPGHMNVLLAEADVPYEQLYEMDEINGEFQHTDVALVVGANDVTNPAARTDASSPIYGMPILNVDQAANIIVMKRSMRPGFAGVDNPLYFDPKTAMLFGDARDSLSKLVSSVKAAGGALVAS
ncbi:MAG TPA: NAD(P)(+) transhydrogenase (Re/Si-specific) subunit beta [Chloroflexota bacterium]|nr:NAD(P)(+) transhydrogenase (Re/Si-specific) subunit beta [Chloroflexota bacterium]